MYKISETQVDISNRSVPIFKRVDVLVCGGGVAGHALERAYGALRQDGSSKAIAGELYQFEAFSRLMGFEAVWEFDRAHAEIQAADKPA